MHAVSCGGGNTNNLDFNFNDASAFWLYWNGSGGNNVKFGSDGDYGDGEWHHCAATRYNGMVRVWIDGSHKGSNNYNSSTAMGQTASIYVGGKGGVYWDGYLDEVRVVKGTALWKGSNDFVPPTRRGAGGPVIDRSSNRNNGTLLNGTDTDTSTYRVGEVIRPIESAVWDFDGTDEFLTTPFGSGRNVYTDPVSVCAWVKADSATAARMWLDVGGNGANQRFYCALITASNPSIFGIQGSGWSYGASADTSKWYHQALVMDNGTARAYYDGIAAGTRAFTSYTLPSYVRIGGRSSYEWDGKIAAVQIYDTILTPQQVKENFNQQRSRFGV
jgi:hypothetical protein